MIGAMRAAKAGPLLQKANGEVVDLPVIQELRRF
jgi:hypothetical protein